MSYFFGSLLGALIFVSHSVDAIDDSIVFESSTLAYEDQEAYSFRQYELEHLELMGARFHAVECYVGDEKMGSLSYVKLPLLTNMYVVDSFYVHPEHRNKGYGSALLKYVCDYLQSMGATAIYIQPGPFELERVPEGFIAPVRPMGELYAAKLQQLIAFYKKHQFVPASKWLIPVIRQLYKWMQINEDAQYLMVKK